MKLGRAANWALALALVVVPPAMAASSGPTEGQTASVSSCEGLFGRGWDDGCLLNRLRDPGYFGISRSDASDPELLDFLRANREAIVALLLQIDWGGDVERFVKNRSTTLATENEKAFVETLGKAGTITGILGQVASALSALQQTAAWAAASESLTVLRQILFGIQVYELAAQVSISHGERTVLNEYFHYRRDSTREAAWRELSTTLAFERPLLQISRNKQIRMERLNEWFESAYVAYRLVALSDSDEIRHSQGAAIARLTKRVGRSNQCAPLSQEVVLAALFYIGEIGGENAYVVAPFLVHSRGQIRTLPDGVERLLLTDADFRSVSLGDGVFTSSPRVLAAKQESILNRIKDFDIFRGGERVGCFSVTGTDVMYIGALPKVIGRGTPVGFTPQVNDIAMVVPAMHASYLSSTTLSAAQQRQLLVQAHDMIPRTLPADWANHLGVPEAAGKPLSLADMRTTTHVLDLRHDGKIVVFLNLAGRLKSSLGPLPADGDISLLASYDENRGSWRKILDCRYSWDLQGFWDSGCWLKGVVDLNGDGVAEIVLSRGQGEVGDIEVYEVSGEGLKLLVAIRGWTGS
jgi:hypothetical protein